jgi:hypothetical protein
VVLQLREPIVLNDVAAQKREKSARVCERQADEVTETCATFLPGKSTCIQVQYGKLTVHRSVVGPLHAGEFRLVCE